MGRRRLFVQSGDAAGTLASVGKDDLIVSQGSQDMSNGNRPNHQKGK